MMAKNNKDLLATNKMLRSQNKMLQKQLREAKKSYAAGKTENIDALVRSDKNKLKIYTEIASDKTYRVLVEKMHEGAVTVDKEGTILYANFYFSNMVKFPLQKITGTKFTSFIAHSSAESLDSLLTQGWEKAVKGEVYINSKDDKTIPVLVSANTFLLDGNLVLGIILTDLSLQKKNEEELKQRAIQLQKINSELETTNKDLVSLTYVSSHHLQEPLRKIQTIVSFILEEENNNLSETGKAYFERMIIAARRMQDLIKDLLTYSSVGISGQNFEKTDLNLIIDEVRKDYHLPIQERKATIDTYNLSNVTIIRSQFLLLFRNLISNSLKFSLFPKKIKIKIKSRVVKGYKIENIKQSSELGSYHITYTDNGMGFDPQYSRRIFEVFQRLHNPEDYGGTGMGLAICKRIVENHKGVIIATGRLNKGARFDIYIPAS